MIAAVFANMDVGAAAPAITVEVLPPSTSSVLNEGKQP
jgi:hypothetical protein